MQQEFINQENINREMIQFSQDMVQKSTKPLFDLNDNDVFKNLRLYLSPKHYAPVICRKQFEQLIKKYAMKETKTIEIPIKCSRCDKHIILDFFEIENHKFEICK